MKIEKQRFLVIDGNNLLYSSYYASQKLPWLMTNGAIFFFLRVMISLLKKNTYQKLLLVFDGGGVNFRKSLLPQYKAQRESMPEELREQMEILKELFTKIKITYLQLVDCEADDVIASFVTQNAHKPELTFDIFTRDKDLLQLINQNTNILKYIKEKLTLYTQQNFHQEYNFFPSNYVDYLSLLGDNVDNIEGVRGIGPVNAKKLIQQFHTVENIYQASDALPDNVKNLLIDKQELVFCNKKIIGLENKLTLPLLTCDFNWEKWRNDPELRKFCVDKRFRSILKLLG